jgi:hypothetical protein
VLHVLRATSGGGFNVRDVSPCDANYGVVPKQEKGYADSAALIERPDFDWRKDQAERENSLSLRWSRNRW